MVAPRKESAPSSEARETVAYDPGLGSRMQAIRSSMAQYRRVMQQTGFESHEKTRETEEWVNRTKLTDDHEDHDNITSREEFFNGHAREMMRSALELHDDFTRPLENAYSRKLISRSSYYRWKQRYAREGNFMAKRYWVSHQFPAYIERWEKVCDDRKQLLANPALKQLATNRDVIALQNESTFLDMHYDKRVDLLAKVRAAMSVEKKDGGNGLYKKLHEKATGLLYAAAAEGVMSKAKIGTWLDRIFKGNAKPEVIGRFLSGGSSNSLPALISKWRKVRAKYDDVCRKGAPLKNPAIGMYLIPPERFLGMHYAQRLQWVEETEQRINDAVNIDKELPVFIHIRHALDLKDWEDADRYIKQASGMELGERDKNRLDSMKRYLAQMRSKKKKKGSGSSAESKNSPEKAAQVCAKIDAILTGGGIPSSMRSVVDGLLATNEANRGINQFRWIVYNNKWCRDHNYLKYEQAKKGASQQASEQTHIRSKNNIETKRRQDHSLDDKNSGQDAFRNTDFAKRRATLLHVDLTSSGPANLTTWLQKPQHPRELYWTTFCGHDNGQPMSEGWHNDLFSNLTELRGLTRQLEGMGYRYSRSGPVKRYSSELVTAAVADKAGETSHAMAA